MKKRMIINIYKNGKGPVLVFGIILDDSELLKVKEAIDDIIRELMSGEYNQAMERLKVDIAVKYSEQNDLFSMNVFDDDKLTRVKDCFLQHPVMQYYGIMDAKSQKLKV